jgi:hypothetical protein
MHVFNITHFGSLLINIYKDFTNARNETIPNIVISSVLLYIYKTFPECLIGPNSCQSPRGVHPQTLETTALWDVNVLCPSPRENNNHSYSHEIPHHLWNQKFHSCVHKSPPADPILSQMNPLLSPHPTPNWRTTPVSFFNIFVATLLCLVACFVSSNHNRDTYCYVKSKVSQNDLYNV